MGINKSKAIRWAIVLLCTVAARAQAQAPDTLRQGAQMESIEVEILRDRRITLPDISRSFDKIPPRAAEPRKADLIYDFKSLTFPLPKHKSSAHPMRLKQEELPRVDGNFISVGFGNYISPYLEAALNTKRNEKRSYGVHLRHRSFINGPVDGKNSGFFDTRIKAYGELYGQELMAAARIGYENRVGYFYGYERNQPVRRDTTQQVYHKAFVNLHFTNAKKSPFNYAADVDLSYLANRYHASESDISLAFAGSYRINEKSAVLLVSNYSFIERQDQVVKNGARHLFKLAPSFQITPLAGLTLAAGVNMMVENDSLPRQTFYIYPSVSIDYRVIPDLTVYANVKGDIQKVSLHTLSDENFWINAGVTPYHTNRSYEFTIGLRGRVAKQVSLEGGFSRVGLRSWYMYRSAPSNIAKFDVEYDDVEQLNAFFAASYNKDELVAVTLRGDYFHYDVGRNPQPWYKPTYRLALYTSFNIYKKITVDLDFIGRGGMYGFNEKTAPSAQVTLLDPALDLNVRVNYFFSKQFSAFFKCENVLSTRYPLYLNYPARGIQILAGVGWSF